MLRLTLAILTSALISIFMRLSSGRSRNNMVMFTANYFVCALLSAGFEFGGTGEANAADVRFAILLGALTGVLFLTNFLLLQVNIRRSGMVLSSLFMKLGVLIPTLAAMVIYHEQPGAWTVIGFLLALAALFVVNLDGQGSGAAKINLLLVILLLCGGFTDCLSNVFDKSGHIAARDMFLLSTFLAAMLLSAALAVYRKQTVTRQDLLWGALIGLPNYFTSRFLLLSLAQLPATVVYPAYNIGTILVITSAGVLFFRESLSRSKTIGLLMILLSLLLLNL